MKAKATVYILLGTVGIAILYGTYLIGKLFHWLFNTTTGAFR